MVETDEQTHKCKAFFFERIPALAYEARDGTTKFRIRTKVHMYLDFVLARAIMLSILW